MRRSGRIPKVIVILLVGSDMEGKVFSEETRTVVLSRHGAGITSQYKLVPEQELILRRLDTNSETEIRVVGQIGAQADSYTYGVAFLDPEVDFWGVKFPLLTDSEIQATRALLECSGCKHREAVLHSELEVDVLAINEGIVRFCKDCGSSTFWKQTSGSPQYAAGSPEPAQKQEPSYSSNQAATQSVSAPVAQKPIIPEENRRRYNRTKVSCKACIRQIGHTLDVVACEDMSRGGLRFKSRKRYFQGTSIEVAVPYSPSPGVQSIFVHARIVYVQELPDEKLFCCGVEYLK
ncbi:MAG TPA: PilZ domain-containing protein [Candidatus Acidoferrum sp.]|nr:PilZ domain-containing protein [Candidatus Acidoferrum sp.]